jgi:hypothetical protein
MIFSTVRTGREAGSCWVNACEADVKQKTQAKTGESLRISMVIFLQYFKAEKWRGIRDTFKVKGRDNFRRRKLEKFNG